jgi:transcription elongation factor GreB
MSDQPNYITPMGYKRLREEYEALFSVDRPKLVETISWAAGNGDRSENGDYIYGRKKLREIDRRLGWLAKRMKVGAGGRSVTAGRSVTGAVRGQGHARGRGR